jgi:hypothetical protein
MIARFPFGGTESYQTADWLVKNIQWLKAQDNVSEVLHMSVDDTPITASRNRVVKRCLKEKVDYLLMLDSDMVFDLPGPGAKPFLPTAWEFVHKFGKPACIAAPYVGKPPVENIFIFRWANTQSDHPNSDFRLVQFSREEAAFRAGIEEVAALPTGLILIDVRAFGYVGKPWFKYEWEDEEESEKATTEDVFLCRNLSLAGVPQFVAWDCWAGHIKSKVCGRPVLITPDQVGEQLREALARPRSGQRLVMIGEGESPVSLKNSDRMAAHHVAPVER